MPQALVEIVVVGIKGINNWCSSWNPLVLDCAKLEKERTSFSCLMNGKETLTLEEEEEDDDDDVIEVELAVVVVVLAAREDDLQPRTTAERSQSSAI